MTQFVPDDVYGQLRNLNQDLDTVEMLNISNVKAAARRRDYNLLLAWLEDSANRKKYLRGMTEGDGFDGIQPLSQRAKEV